MLKKCWVSTGIYFKVVHLPKRRVAIAEQTEKLGLAYSHCVVSDEPDVFFQQFDLEQQIVPQTFVYSPMFEVLFHRVGILTEEDIATVVRIGETNRVVFKREEDNMSERSDLIRSVLKTAFKQSATGARVVGQQSKKQIRIRNLTQRKKIPCIKSWVKK